MQSTQTNLFSIKASNDIDAGKKANAEKRLINNTENKRNLCQNKLWRH